MKILSLTTICILFCLQTIYCQTISTDAAFVIETVQKNQFKKEKTITSIDLLKKYYEGLTSFPETITDGWHNVISTDHGSFCYERKVYVENNRVTKYIVDDWRFVNMLSTPISQGKSVIQLLNEDGSKSDLVEIFFLHFINDSNAVASPPTEPGKVSFWSNFKRGGDIDIFVDGKFIGKVDSYFDESAPQCAQKGTVTYKNKAGTYTYKAVSSRYTWSGKFTITTNGCGFVKLSK